MTENQENELFKTLGTLVSGVNQIQSDVRDIKGTLADHTATLADHTATLADHTATLANHTATLAEHSHKLDLLVARTDSIAGTVMEHEERLRVIEGLGGKVQ